MTAHEKWLQDTYAKAKAEAEANPHQSLESWRKRYKPYTCCDQAVPLWCVCEVSFICLEHGQRCVGSHD